MRQAGHTSPHRAPRHRLRLRPLRRRGPADQHRVPRLRHRSRRRVAGLRLTARAERVGGGLGARRPLVALLLFVAVAALGYEAGHGVGGHGSSSTSTRTVLVDGVLLDYPSAWKRAAGGPPDRKSTRLNSSHGSISYAVFCLKK